MENNTTLKTIAYARNGHTDKFGIPRQSRDESPIVTRIVFEPDYSVAEALRLARMKAGVLRFVRRAWAETNGWVFLPRVRRSGLIRWD